MRRLLLIALALATGAASVSAARATPLGRNDGSDCPRLARTGASGLEPGCADIVRLDSATTGWVLTDALPDGLWRVRRQDDGAWHRVAGTSSCLGLGASRACPALRPTPEMPLSDAVQTDTGLVLPGPLVSVVRIDPALGRVSQPAGRDGCFTGLAVALCRRIAGLAGAVEIRQIVARGDLLAVRADDFTFDYRIVLLRRNAAGGYEQLGACIGTVGTRCAYARGQVRDVSIALDGGRLWVMRTDSSAPGCDRTPCVQVDVYPVDDTTGLGPSEETCAGTTPGCVPLPASQPRRLVQSPGDDEAYVVDGDALVAIHDGPSGIAVGACLAPSAAHGCVDAGLPGAGDGIASVGLAPGGTSGIATTRDGRVVNVTRDAATGALAPVGGAGSCLGPDAPCTALARYAAPADHPEPPFLSAGGARAIVPGADSELELAALGPPACTPQTVISGLAAALTPCRDPNRDPFTLAVASGPAHGRAVADGTTLRYTAAHRAVGDDPLTLAVTQDGATVDVETRVHVVRSPSIRVTEVGGARRIAPGSARRSAPYGTLLGIRGAIRSFGGPAPTRARVAIPGTSWRRVNVGATFDVPRVLRATRSGDVLASLPDYPDSAVFAGVHLLVYPIIEWDRSYHVAGGLAVLGAQLSPPRALRRGTVLLERLDGHRWLRERRGTVALHAGGRFELRVPVPTARVSYRVTWTGPASVGLAGVQATVTLEAALRRAPRVLRRAVGGASRPLG